MVLSRRLEYSLIDLKGLWCRMAAMPISVTRVCSCLFHINNLSIMVLVYVYHIIIIRNSTSFIYNLIKNLNEKFALKKLGNLVNFLYNEVTHLPNGSLLLSESKYVCYLLANVNMSYAKGIPTPMISISKLSRIGSDVVTDSTQFRYIIGALQYATLTRPEIYFSLNKMCCFLSNPLH